MALDRRVEVPAAQERHLPVRVVEPPRRTRRRRRYQPKHALDVPRGKDRTTIWLFVVLILTSGFVAGTTAAFSASATDSGNIFGSATLSNPAGQTISLRGGNLSLGITAFGGFDGTPSVTYGARWRSMWPTGVSTTGSSYGCSAATSAYTNDLADSPTSTTSIDYTGVPGFADGRWMCIMAHTAYPATKPAPPAVQWYSQKDNPNQSVQVGHVVQSVNLLDVAGTAGRIQRNDKLVITFNQPVDPAGRPASGVVCARSANSQIFVGGSVTNCNSNNPASVSVLTLRPAPGVAITSNGSYTSTIWSWSADGRELTITLDTSANAPITGCATGSGCFRVRMDKTADAATALESAQAPVRALCTTADDENFDNGSCEPYATGSF